ncbi:Ribonuclease T2 [Sphaceloma murrayae]|uniref:ribonuclease T2 n=1 Tax=Sphaceloma murrayae TaxID=2082308 RepID=A0A2K1QZ02_9PEZI|nr:Ribonuclease T2 [Sphaceloma murrayae]
MRVPVALSVILAAFWSESVVAVGPHCSLKAPLSCHGNATITDTCCTEVQGQVLSVQFWDTNPATGPEDHWTIHGLWPDNCDGTYEQFCDPSREYANISCILEAAGPRGRNVLSFMQKYWKDQAGQDESFWEHEWNKHGTCYSTLQPKCFGHYKPQEEVVDYFEQATRSFRSLPTYQYLKQAGIVPTTAKNYTYDEFVAALRKPSGITALPRCSKGEVYEVWYTYNVRGSIANGHFERVEPVGEGVGCPSSFKYLPKKMDTVPKPVATKCPAVNATVPTTS